MKAVIDAKSSGAVRQCGKYGMLVRWVVLRTKVEVSMFRFMVCIMAQRAIRSPVNICVQEGDRLSSPPWLTEFFGGHCSFG
jgi:hypothetical protein